MRRSLPLLVAIFFACSDTPEASGELILAIQTDVALPDSVDRIRIEVSSFGTLQLGNDYEVGASALRIPATLGVLRGKDPATPVTIRLIAKKGSQTKMLREIVTTVPDKRIVSLRMPIRWLCDDSAKVGTSGDVTNAKCGVGQTCIAGDCHPSDVDSNGLSDYSAGDVFGGGTGNGDGTCFDVLKCMIDGLPVPVDTSSCTIAKPADPTNINVALRLSGKDGVCDPSQSVCFVVLDEAPIDGWQDLGSRLQLPHEVCNRIANGRVQSVVVSHTCPTKTERDPVCGTWSSAGGPPAFVIVDAGNDGDSSLPKGDGGAGQDVAQFATEQIEPDSGATGCPMRIAGSHLLFCSSVANTNVTLHGIKLPAGPGAKVFDFGLLPSQNQYGGPWIAADFAYWTIFKSPGSYELWSAQIAAEAMGTRLLSFSQPSFDTFYDVTRAIDGSRLYATESNGAPVLAYDRTTGAPTTLANSLVQAMGVRILVADADPVNGFVYVGGHYGSTIARIERVGKNGVAGASLVTTVMVPSVRLDSMLLAGSDLWFLAQQIAPDGITIVNTTIFRVPAAGGAATAVYPIAAPAFQLVNDGSDLYWIQYEGLNARIMKGSTAGAAPKQVVADDDIAVDVLAVGDQIYYGGNSKLDMNAPGHVRAAPK